jgi:hypothetical protein
MATVHSVLIQRFSHASSQFKQEFRIGVPVPEILAELPCQLKG